MGSVIINPLVINNPDVKLLKESLAKTNGNLITVEDHQVNGGMGSAICHALARNNITFKIKSLGVDGQYGQSAYSAIELYQKHKMDSVSIVESAQSLV